MQRRISSCLRLALHRSETSSTACVPGFGLLNSLFAIYEVVTAVFLNYRSAKSCAIMQGSFSTLTKWKLMIGVPPSKICTPQFAQHAPEIVSMTAAVFLRTNASMTNPVFSQHFGLAFCWRRNGKYHSFSRIFAMEHAAG